MLINKEQIGPPLLPDGETSNARPNDVARQ
jgi:hypothetical protein